MASNTASETLNQGSALPVNKSEITRFIKSREGITRSTIAGNPIERRTKINFNQYQTVDDRVAKDNNHQASELGSDGALSNRGGKPR